MSAPVIPLDLFAKHVAHLPPAQQVMLMRLLLLTNPLNQEPPKVMPSTIDWMALADECGIHVDTIRKHARSLKKARLLHQDRTNGRQYNYYVTLPERHEEPG